jgi:YHYH protein
MKPIVRCVALALIVSPVPAFAHDTRLPLGDGKVSATPKIGQVMACDTHFPGGGGAHRSGDWIKDGYWTPSAKPQVEGNVRWPNAQISVRVEGPHRVVRANNLPTHPSGTFPIRPGSQAYGYDRNPNVIAAQSILLRMPVTPHFAKTPQCVPMGMIGFAVSGVAIFNAFDLGGRDAPAYEIQDKCNGHPEITSQYHYHDWSPCLKAASADAPVGWILDGFPILGPVDEKGHEYTNADLDTCHGVTGPVVIDGKRVVTYHYRFTREFPYTIGCFKGAPIPVARPHPRFPPPPRLGLVAGGTIIFAAIAFGVYASKRKSSHAV